MGGSSLDWRKAFREAEGLPHGASRKAKADRGRRFEKILGAMFDEAGLDPRLNYRPVGEEIDGSIWFEGRTILIEAKWTSAPHPASSLYQFKGKVDGKLVGTLGLFISINGFSPDAVDALIAGKEQNIVLADGDDVRALVSGKLSVPEALRRKLREAGERGNPHFSLNAASVSAPSLIKERLVVVEGQADVHYLQSVQSVLGAADRVKIVSAGGPTAMPILVHSLLESTDISSVTLVIDADMERSSLNAKLISLQHLAEAAGRKIEVLWVEPELEVALGLATSDIQWKDRDSIRDLAPEQLEQQLLQAGLIEGARSNESLRQVLTAIGVRVPV